jgi:hypothetical protein
MYILLNRLLLVRMLKLKYNKFTTLIKRSIATLSNNQKQLINRSNESLNKTINILNRTKFNDTTSDIDLIIQSMILLKISISQ